MRDVNWYENAVNNWYREVRRRNLTISSPPVILVSVNQIYFTEVIPVCKKHPNPKKGTYYYGVQCWSIDYLLQK